MAVGTIEQSVFSHPSDSRLGLGLALANGMLLGMT